jgi:hypothetical protein
VPAYACDGTTFTFTYPLYCLTRRKDRCKFQNYRLRFASVLYEFETPDLHYYFSTLTSLVYFELYYRVLWQCANCPFTLSTHHNITWSVWLNTCHVSGLGWRLLSFFIHCGTTGYLGHLGVHTLYNGLRTVVSITDFVKTLLINCKKYGHMFRLDIKLPSDHSNICTQRKLHNYTYISITTKYGGVYGYATSSMYVNCGLKTAGC